MKKVMLSLGAILAFGIASAQTDTQPPPQTQPDAGNPKQSTKTSMDAEVQNNPDGVKPNSKNVTPSKKRNKRTKSTPGNDAVRDTTMSQDAKMPKKVKKA